MDVIKSENVYIINVWGFEEILLSTAVSTKVVQKSVKATMPKGNMGNTQ